MTLVTLDTTFGSILAASWIAAALSGVVLFQCYLFYRSRTYDDSMVFGVLVAVLALFDGAHIICVMVSLYYYLIRDFGKHDELLKLIPSLALTVGFTAMITFIVQCCFAHRVWKLSRGNWAITGLIVLVSTARLACGWVTTTKAITYGTFGDFVIHLRWIFTSGVSLAVISDILITASLCYWLNSSRSGLRQMDAIVDKIVLYTVETGALTSFFSIIALACVIAMPQNLIFIAVHFVISKLYINTLLASLNTRNSLRAKRDMGYHGALSKMRLSTISTSGSRARRSPETSATEVDNAHGAQLEPGFDNAGNDGVMFEKAGPIVTISVEQF